MVVDEVSESCPVSKYFPQEDIEMDAALPSHHCVEFDSTLSRDF